METGDSIEELAQQIYEKHQTAIDLIIKSRPAVKPTDWHIIDGAIEQYAPRLEADQHDDWAHRFYVPEFDEVSDLMRANGWTESGRLPVVSGQVRHQILGSNHRTRSPGHTAASIRPVPEGQRNFGSQDGQCN